MTFLLNFMVKLTKAIYDVNEDVSTASVETATLLWQQKQFCSLEFSKENCNSLPAVKQLFAHALANCSQIN